MANATKRLRRMTNMCFRHTDSRYKDWFFSIVLALLLALYVAFSPLFPTDNAASYPSTTVETQANIAALNQ